MLKIEPFFGSPQHNLFISQTNDPNGIDVNICVKIGFMCFLYLYSCLRIKQGVRVGRNLSKVWT